jgi:hypothetical protein
MKRVRRASDGANELDANIEWGMVAVRAVDTGVRADHFWSLLFVCDAVRTMFTVAPGWGATEVVSMRRRGAGECAVAGADNYRQVARSTVHALPD